MSATCSVCKKRVLKRHMTMEEHKSTFHPETVLGVVAPVIYSVPATPRRSKEKEKERESKASTLSSSRDRKRKAASPQRKEKTGSATKKAKPSPLSDLDFSGGAEKRPSLGADDSKESTVFLDLSGLDDAEPRDTQTPSKELIAALFGEEVEDEDEGDEDEDVDDADAASGEKEEEAVATPGVTCPVCSAPIGSSSELAINQHIDDCLSMKFLKEEEQQRKAAKIYGDNDEEAMMKALEASIRDSGNEIKQGIEAASKRPAPPPPLSYPLTPSLTPLKLPVVIPQTTPSATPPSHILQQLNQLIHRAITPIPAATQQKTSPAPSPAAVSVPAPTPAQHSHGHRRRSIILEKKLADKECAICFEEFDVGAKVRWLECLCVYHTDCIRAWFSKSDSRGCPVHPESE